MSRPRHHPTSSSTRSTSPTQRPTEASDLSWLDFLRSAGGTAPSDRSVSADRKRRRAGTSPERRSYNYQVVHNGASRNITERRSSGMMDTQGPAGSTLQTAIDLTTPPRPTPILAALGDSRRSSTSRRRESDIVLPKWQPDSEVSQCPVCRTEFSFWHRKHHCRKCGRVVCSACSPHRITIPRQYIVQPPSPFDSDNALGEPNSPRSSNPALGGGEVVRVCNPCVPDPWTPDSAPVRPGEPTDIPPRPLIESARNARSHDIRALAERSERYRVHPPPLPPPPAGPHGGRNRSQSHQPTPSHSQLLTAHHPGTSVAFRNEAYTRAPPLPTLSSRSIGHRYSHSSAAPLPPVPAFRDRPAVHSVPSAPPQPRPRREVREEDECPVCGMELAPGEQLREAHVQECITARFSSSTPSNSIPLPPRPALPPPHPSATATGESESAGASASTPTTTTRARATSYRPRGMALYRATEKDCATEDGQPQECVICFEEFQPSDEMGRMECLCKFHRTCIRQWWDTKGVGSCPTHQLHD